MSLLPTRFDSVWQDVRYAARTFRRTLGSSSIVVLTLALGIGATSALFTVVNSLLLRPLPVANPERLVAVSSGASATTPLTYAVWDEIRRQGSSAFDGSFAWAFSRFSLAEAGEPEPVDGLYVSGDFFRTLGVPPLLGRALTLADDVVGSPDGAVAVIGYGLWQRRFGGAADVIGRPVRIEGVPCAIIGVMPPLFFGVEVGRTFDIAVPLGLEPTLRRDGSLLQRRRAFWLTVMLRLKEGQPAAAAMADLRLLQPQIREAAMPEGQGRVQQDFLREPFTVVPAAGGTSGLRQRYERPLMVILVVAGLVLLIACANIANLLLARAAARRGEVSLRFALGASRGRVVRQLLVESLFLAGLGAVAALFVASWGSRLLVSQLSNAVSQVALDLSLDWRVVAFTAAVTIATALTFGIAPAFRLVRTPASDALKEPGRGASASQGRLSGSLVAAQVALSLLLVVSAGLLVRTFERLATKPLGFDSDRVLVVNVNASRALVNPADRIAFYHRLVESVSALPGVERAAASSITPVSGSLAAFPVQATDAPAGTEPQRVLVNYVTPGWFSTYGVPMRAGRDFGTGDTLTSPPVIVVNESFERTLFPGRSALGATVRPLPPPGSDDKPVPFLIVGVVRDAVYRSLREEPQPTLYQPLAQRESRVPPAEMGLSVRAASGSPVSLARSVGATLTAADRQLAFTFRPLADQVGASLAQERLVASLSGFFGLLALLLAGIGLYGITAHGASRRRAEIGIRMALGARQGDVMRLMLRRSLVVTAIGVVIGVTAAFAATKLLDSLLFGLTPRDPVTFVTSAAVFVAVALVATFLPARRASRIDPTSALREG